MNRKEEDIGAGDQVISNRLYLGRDHKRGQGYEPDKKKSKIKFKNKSKINFVMWFCNLLLANKNMLVKKAFLTKSGSKKFYCLENILVVFWVTEQESGNEIHFSVRGI